MAATLGDTGGGGSSVKCMGLCCLWFLLGRRDEEVFRGKYLFKRPTLGETRSKSAMRDAEPTRPLSQTVSFAVVRQESCFASILPLFQRSRPFAVSRFIVAIVVNAFDTVFDRRLFSHVGKEIRLVSF